VAENNSPAITLGDLGSENSKGLTLVSGTLSLSPASATNPGILTTNDQTFGGVKSFSGIKISTGTGMEVSKGLFTDNVGKLTTTGTLGVSQGGTGISSYPANSVLTGSGSAITAITPNALGNILTYTNTGWAAAQLTIGSLNSSGTTNGMTLSNANVFQLSPADASNPGIVTTGLQTIAGAKTFTGAMTLNSDVTMSS
jgi:hypothetical protein